MLNACRLMFDGPFARGFGRAFAHGFGRALADWLALDVLRRLRMRLNMLFGPGLGDRFSLRPTLGRVLLPSFVGATIHLPIVPGVYVVFDMRGSVYRRLMNRHVVEHFIASRLIAVIGVAVDYHIAPNVVGAIVDIKPVDVGVIVCDADVAVRETMIIDIASRSPPAVGDAGGDEPVSVPTIVRTNAPCRDGRVVADAKAPCIRAGEV